MQIPTTLLSISGVNSTGMVRHVGCDGGFGFVSQGLMTFMISSAQSSSNALSAVRSVGKHPLQNSPSQS